MEVDYYCGHVGQKEASLDESLDEDWASGATPLIFGCLILDRQLKGLSECLFRDGEFFGGHSRFLSNAGP